MKRPFVRSVGLIVVCCLSACEQAPVPTAATAPPAGRSPAAAPASSGTDLIAAGAAAWEQGKCSKCHGAEGGGTDRAPDLTDGEWIHCDGTLPGIRQVLVTGVPEDQLVDPDRPFAMNPVTNLVAEDQLDALAAYVLSLSGS